MKKAWTLLLALYLLLNTIGYNVYAHFCGDSLVETSILFAAESCCGDEGPEEEEGCCKNEVEQVQLDSRFLPKDNLTILHSCKPGIALFYKEQRPSFPLLRIICPDQSIHSPPLGNKDIPILYQVFRI